jgi:hypothetical protein
MDYRAYLLDEHAHIVDAHTFVAASDEAALFYANQYANGRDVEVWHRSRRIGLIPREPKSIDPERWDDAKANISVTNKGPNTAELIQDARDEAENAIILCQDIEFHLVDAKNNISRIRQMIQEFDLQQAARRDGSKQ